MSTLLTITETEPTPLLRDFAVFLGYAEAHPMALTQGHETISGRDLYELNQAMTNPVPDTTPRTRQTLHPLLHLFYHLSLAGRLFQKVPGKGGKLALKPTERLKLYEALKPAERYFFLLETLWIDADWMKLVGGYFEEPLYSAPLVLKALSTHQPGKCIHLRGARETPDMMPVFVHWRSFALYFSFFGFWQVTSTQDSAAGRARLHFFQADSITPSAFGVTLAPVLNQARELPYWNLPSRRKGGEWNAVSGSPLPKGSTYEVIYGDLVEALNPKKPKAAGNAYRGKPGEPFFLPFVPLFAEGELRQTLPREGVKFVDGTYVFKVVLRSNLWRRIEMSAGHSLLDLHDAIQEAFDFDDDHLYSFFMDGEAWSDEKFTSPHDEEGPHVDEVRIGEIGLLVGKRIVYLFDYGDCWQFRVEVEDIRTEGPKPRKPRIVEKKGKAPEQYPDYG